MHKNMMVSAGLVITLLFVSLSVAYVTFNILESSAEASLQNWKFGGAFAAFAFTVLLAGSQITTMYKLFAQDEAADLRERMAALQEKHQQELEYLRSKLIRGTPAPAGFAIELDERQGLVFARPESWRHQQGILYQFVDRRQPPDFSPNFNVTVNTLADVAEQIQPLLPDAPPLNTEAPDLHELYTRTATATLRLMAATLPQYLEDPTPSYEYVTLDGLKALKFTHTFSAALARTEATQAVCQAGVLIYVPHRRRLYQFSFTDDAQSYLATSDVFNAVVASIRFF